MRVPKIGASWDGEAGVWVAESQDVPRLATEAPTLEEFLTKLAVMVPELLEENGVRVEPPVVLHLEATRPLVLSRFLRLFAKLLTGRRLSPEERRRLEEGAAASEEEGQAHRLALAEISQQEEER
jgi:hypothetical protein